VDAGFTNAIRHGAHFEGKAGVVSQYSNALTSCQLRVKGRETLMSSRLQRRSDRAIVSDEKHHFLARTILGFPIIVSLAITVAEPRVVQSQTRGAATAHAAFSVKINTVFQIATQPQILYRISYSYDFPGHKRIYIRGVGSVPSKGDLNYISSEGTIEFLDAAGGNLLYLAKIEHPVTLMGASAPSIPDEAEFPRESRTGHWSGQGPFAERAFAVLNNAFPSGYRTYEKDNLITYVSTYKEVPQSDDGTHTEVSVLIQYPISDAVPNVRFTVAFKGLERRSHTDWRSLVSDSSKKSAETFADGIFSALEHQ